jgi:hypothetical protein
VKSQKTEPRILVQQVSCAPGSGLGLWLVTWQIENQGIQPLQILATRFPHSQFHWEEQLCHPAIKISRNQSVLIPLSVACAETPGTIVENAFLILRVLWMDGLWRIFTRLRVHFDDQGAPQAVTEVVTTHRVGFSKAMSSGS